MAIHQHLSICNLVPCSSKTNFVKYSGIFCKKIPDVCNYHHRGSTSRRSKTPHMIEKLLYFLHIQSLCHCLLHLESMVRCEKYCAFILPLKLITIGILLEKQVLSMRTAFSAAGSDVVVATEVVEVTVGVTSSHSNESHGHPVGQFP